MEHSHVGSEPAASEPTGRVAADRPGLLRLVWQLGALDGTATGVELRIAERRRALSGPGEVGTTPQRAGCSRKCKAAVTTP
jgi:hypothetical protein